MAKTGKATLILLVLYVIIFLVGFRSGEIYHRIKKGYRAERVIIPSAESYFVVEERDFGAYRSTDIYECGPDHALVKLMKEARLRPLLKRKKIEIYDAKGERVY